jgi:hypothetical protein
MLSRWITARIAEEGLYGVKKEILSRSIAHFGFSRLTNPLSPLIFN